MAKQNNVQNLTNQLYTLIKHYNIDKDMVHSSKIFMLIRTNNLVWVSSYKILSQFRSKRGYYDFSKFIAKIDYDFNTTLISCVKPTEIEYKIIFDTISEFDSKLRKNELYELINKTSVTLFGAHKLVFVNDKNVQSYMASIKVGKWYILNGQNEIPFDENTQSDEILIEQKIFPKIKTDTNNPFSNFTVDQYIKYQHHLNKIMPISNTNKCKKNKRNIEVCNQQLFRQLTLTQQVGILNNWLDEIDDI